MSGEWFDWRMSVGNLITIGVVLAGVMAGWFKFDNRLASIEKDVAMHRQLANEALLRLEGRVASVEATRLTDIAQLQEMSGRMIRIEEKQTNQTETLHRILRSLERRDFPGERMR